MRVHIENKDASIKEKDGVFRTYCGTRFYEREWDSGLVDYVDE